MFNRLITFKKKLRKWGLIVTSTILVSIVGWYSLPTPLFVVPYSMVINDYKGELLSARIADDGQWRFPMSGNSINPKFVICLTQFEDRWFDYHPGINPLSLARAIWLNIKHGKKFSGGSTLTMQVIRMYRKKPRTYCEKFKELLLAVRLELQYSKNEILSLYAAHAPFGGNTVGLETAAWRYYNRSSTSLSWAECAALAVLPNHPSGIFPGKNESAFRQKRNRLLKRLYDEKLLDKTDYHLALQEPLPGAPKTLPNLVSHLLLHTESKGVKGQLLNSTLHKSLQERVGEIVNNYAVRLAANEVHNVATMVVHNPTGKVLAYVGNVEKTSVSQHADVNMITAKRSTGSLLKPFLFALMLEGGLLYPSSLLRDIPLHIHGYAPKNFNLNYSGLIPAQKALGRSLNVPSVVMLQQYGVAKFKEQLKRLGMTTLQLSAQHYGLSLILGGAEGKLWDLCGMYSVLAQLTINKKPKEIHFYGESIPTRQTFPISPAVAWLTLNAMADAARPDLEAAWADFDGNNRLAWKTGTSFGFRDAWSIGVSPEFTVGVWVGNATGQGRPGVVGIQAAAPIMFDIFGKLPRSGWFIKPLGGIKKQAICKQSGYKLSEYCQDSIKTLTQSSDASVPICPFHKKIWLNEEGTHRINAECYPLAQAKAVNYMILSPVEEYYYVQTHPEFKKLPPWLPECETNREQVSLQLLYPTNGIEIYIPRSSTKEKPGIIARAIHKQNDMLIYWTLNHTFLGITQSPHQLLLNPSKGSYTLAITDQDGHSQEIRFKVLGNE